MAEKRLRTMPSSEHGAHWPIIAGGLVLTALYVWSYLGMDALPGASARNPEGWWGWWDQGKTLVSAQALVAGDLAPARHWYPLGYAALGAPFVALAGWMGMPAHAFVALDAACLVLTFGGFVAFAGRCLVRPWTAAALFVGSAAWDRQMLGEWAIPWNSSPAAALIWLLLAQCAGWMAGVRRPFLLGALAAAVPLCRPTEALAVAMCLAWALLPGWRGWATTQGARAYPPDRTGRRLVQDWARVAAGGLLVVVPYAALHLAIYGPRTSEYLQQSGALGFTLHDFGWKAFVVLADPYPWFLDAPSLLQRLPWMALGLAGFVPALRQGRAPGMLAAALAVHLVLYLSYLDLLPTGVWRYNNVHYWKWALPGYGLLGWLLLRDMVWWRGARRRGAAPYGAAGLALLGALSVLRLAPREIEGVGPAKMLEFHGDAPDFADAYFGPVTVQDARGRMVNITDIRAFPVPGGLRVIALTRPFEGPATLLPADGLAPGLLRSIPARFDQRLVPGRPCWLIRCGARPLDPLLPPVP